MLSNIGLVILYPAKQNHCIDKNDQKNYKQNLINDSKLLEIVFHLINNDFDFRMSNLIMEPSMRHSISK